MIFEYLIHLSVKKLPYNRQDKNTSNIWYNNVLKYIISSPEKYLQKEKYFKNLQFLTKV